nr:MAG TPA: putative Strongylid L4 protein [Caudoviricetes sp.]
MKPIISLERRDAILALSNKRTETICKLVDNNHADDFYTILRLVDHPVGTPEEIRNATDYQHINAISEWYDLIDKACQRLHELGLTMTDHVSVYWYDAETQTMVWEYADELLFRTDEQDPPYEGQRLYASAIGHYALDVCDKLETALLYCDSEEAKRLLDVIKSAIKEYI